MPKIARRILEHVDEKSVFKHDLNVHRPEEGSVKVIEFDHKTLRQAPVATRHFHSRHKTRP
ncbi:unnamed protein product, partial [marine sediment metagenome]